VVRAPPKPQSPFRQGFTEALNLSNKMVQLYKLSSEQLSKQGLCGARFSLCRQMLVG